MKLIVTGSFTGELTVKLTEGAGAGAIATGAGVSTRLPLPNLRATPARTVVIFQVSMEREFVQNKAGKTRKETTQTESV